MGSALFEIGEILGARGCIKAKKLRNGGTLFVRITKAEGTQHGNFNLALRGIKLKNVEGMFSKSDPFFVVSAQVDAAGGRTWQPVYRSEAIQNNLNPVWKELTITVEKLCSGNRKAPLQIEVFDWEKSGKHRSMGKFETSLDGLVSALSMGGSGTFNKQTNFTLMHKGKSYGNIVVTKAFLQSGAQPQYTATGYGQTQAPANSPPPNQKPKKFIKINGINKINPDYKRWQEAQQAQSQPPPFTAAAAAALLPTAPPAHQMTPPLPMPPPPTVTNSSNSKPKFVDYLSGGTEINLAVAIDYTGSNGDPRKPGTLHHLHLDGQLNDYEKALTAVGSIIARYDSDQKFPVFGFGAKYGGVIQHCFQVGKAAELNGVSGMLEGYRGVFRTGLTMSGPTVFADVIQQTAAQAKRKQDASRAIGQQSYTILLILTDGAVTDIEQTKIAIRNASTAPLSIVIVGVGQADFSTMQFLDDFQQNEGGHTRDIVQFVELNRHAHSRQNLTKETLDEIPDQLVDYFFSNGVMPLRPVSGSKLNIFEEDYDSEQDIDLGMAMNSEGEICLANPAQATWDAQSYGTASAFLPPAMAPQASSAQSMYGGGRPGGAPPAPYGGPTAAAYNNSGQPHSIYGSASPGPSSSGAPSSVYGSAAPTPPGSYGQQQQQQQPLSYGGAPSSIYGSQHHQHHQQHHQQQQQQQQQQQPYGGGFATTHPVATTTPSTTLVNIRAPPNSYPGMQLRVQNPSSSTTGQFTIVVVPQGVPPGSTFAVQLL